MSTSPTFKLPPLGYGYDALEPAYSAELLELHYAAHHKAYVDKANDTLINLSHTRQVQDGSAKMSISTVPLYGQTVEWTKGKPE